MITTMLRKYGGGFGDERISGACQMSCKLQRRLGWLEWRLRIKLQMIAAL